MDKQTKTILIIIATLGVAGLIFLLRKPSVSAAAVGQGPVSTVGAAQVPTTCQGRAIQLAMQQTGVPESELTVRSLLPNDVGLNTWSFNLAGVGWNTVVSTNVADNRFLCISGVSYSGTAAEQIRVRVGASTVAQFSIEQVPGITTTHHIDINPILAQQNLPIEIDVYASAISATDNVILEGITVEKRGMVLAY